MTRAKVGYDFCPVPQDIAPAWGTLPYQTRMLGISLWMLGRGEPIPVPDAGWVVYLCAKLEINGRDRPNISRALLHLQELCLLTVSGGSAVCLLRVCATSALRLPSVCATSDSSKPVESLEVDSTEEKRREEKRQKREAQAPAPDGALTLFADEKLAKVRVKSPRKPDTLVAHVVAGYTERYKRVMNSLPGSRLSSAAGQVASWAKATAEMQRSTPEALVDRALDGFFAQRTGAVFTSGYPLAFMSRNPGQYLNAGQPPKPTGPWAVKDPNDDWRNYPDGIRPQVAR
jgi:hypothetical protein